MIFFACISRKVDRATPKLVTDSLPISRERYERLYLEVQLTPQAIDATLLFALS